MRTLLLIAAVLAAGITGAWAAAPRDPVDIVIEHLLKKQIITAQDAEELRAEIAAARKEQTAAAAKSGAPVTAKTPVKVSGYIQARYQHSEADGFNDGGDIRRARVSLEGTPLPALDWRLQWDLAGSRRAVTGVSAGPPLTTSTANVGRAQLLDAIIGYRLPSGVRLQAGQFKIPFGVENLQSSTRLELINRSPVTESLVPGRDLGAQGRDAGVMVSGASKGAEVEYWLGIFNGAGINTGDDNDRKDIAARLTWKPVKPLHLGAAIYDGATGSARNRHDRTGLELIYQADRWKLQAEYIEGRDGARKKLGWYATAVADIGRGSSAALRYSYLDADRSTASDATACWTVGWTHAISSDGATRFQINYEKNDEQGSDIRNDAVLMQLQTAF